MPHENTTMHYSHNGTRYCIAYAPEECTCYVYLPRQTVHAVFSAVADAHTWACTMIDELELPEDRTEVKL